MVENIQLAFRRNIKNLVWMDQKTKQATIEKISKMKTCIGYPPWLEIPSEVDNYYEEYMNVRTNSSSYNTALCRYIFAMSIIARIVNEYRIMYLCENNIGLVHYILYIIKK